MLATAVAIAAIPTVGAAGAIVVTMTIAGGVFVVGFQGAALVAELMDQPVGPNARSGAATVSDLTHPFVLAGGTTAMVIGGSENFKFGMEVGRLFSIANDVSALSRAGVKLGADEMGAGFGAIEGLRQLDVKLLYRKVSESPGMSGPPDADSRDGRGAQQRNREGTLTLQRQYEQQRAEHERQRYIEQLRAHAAAMEAERQREDDRQRRDAERKADEDRQRFLREEQERRNREEEERRRRAEEAARAEAHRRQLELERQMREEWERSQGALNRMAEEERRRGEQARAEAERSRANSDRRDRDPVIFWWGGGGGGSSGGSPAPTPTPVPIRRT